ncbi:adhesive plaque matrix protein 2-like [Ischnura elegans]|uniref:adhesive plaque matrix protein 2-like n=1 Tax=Ischnura elegans TaxID=197161 RepID=UPI001ED8B8AF|nr:adhesive plaque matrix protein 2-like [Ischnura elegans]
MFPKVSFVTATILVSVICLNFAEACDENQTRLGCKIDDGRICVCGIGCATDYRYNNKDECRRALKGRSHNICSENPCLNDGACSQTTVDPGYRCRCEGTGFYGSRCEHACPSSTNQRYMRKYPYECIVI